MVPEPPPAELAPSCAEAGVLGVLPGIVGSIQAIEAIKLLLDLGDPLIGRLLAYDSLEQSFREFKVQVDPTNEITWAVACRRRKLRVDGFPTLGIPDTGDTAWMLVSAAMVLLMTPSASPSSMAAWSEPRACST